MASSSPSMSCPLVLGAWLASVTPFLAGASSSRPVLGPWSAAGNQPSALKNPCPCLGCRQVEKLLPLLAVPLGSARPASLSPGPAHQYFCCFQDMRSNVGDEALSEKLAASNAHPFHGWAAAKARTWQVCTSGARALCLECLQVLMIVHHAFLHWRRCTAALDSLRRLCPRPPRRSLIRQSRKAVHEQPGLSAAYLFRVCHTEELACCREAAEAAQQPAGYCIAAGVDLRPCTNHLPHGRKCAAETSDRCNSLIAQDVYVVWHCKPHDVAGQMLAAASLATFGVSSHTTDVLSEANNVSREGSKLRIFGGPYTAGQYLRGVT